jgi:sugar phosphate isomerase/epimerase
VFVPKAQTSQWELQLMPLASVGNILEADAETRKSLDRAMLVAVRILSAMGARMITSVEASKRFDRTDSDQRLIYFFLPRLPESPGAFSEAQLRWINRHYPEDIATACRQRLPAVLNAIERERS